MLLTLTSSAGSSKSCHTTTRSIAEITANFLKTLDAHVSQLGRIVEESQTVNDKQLSDLEKKFGVI